jgi:hypothetical protein
MRPHYENVGKIVSKILREERSVILINQGCLKFSAFLYSYYLLLFFEKLYKMNDAARNLVQKD